MRISFRIFLTPQRIKYRALMLWAAAFLAMSTPGCDDSVRRQTTVSATAPGQDSTYLTQRTIGDAGNSEIGLTITGASGPFDQLRTNQAVLNLPVSGLFVGVSNYADHPELKSTPAHAIGAMLAQELFLRTKTVQNWRSAGEFAVHGANELQLVTSLRMRPADQKQLFPGLVATFTSIIHQYPVFDYSDRDWRTRQDSAYTSTKLNEDGTFNYLGTDKYVTRSRLMASVREHANRLKTGEVIRNPTPNSGEFFSFTFTQGGASVDMADKAEEKLPRVAVLYIATHGAIGSDGRDYIAVADSVHDDPSTWVAVDDILQPYFEAARSTSPRNLQLLLIVDACRTFGDIAAKRTEPVGPIPTNVTLMQTTSPGRYAFHWINKKSSRITVESHTTGLLSSRRTIPEGVQFDVDFGSYMSAFPLAAHIALREKIADGEEFIRNYVKTVPPELRQGTINAGFTIEAWMQRTQEELRKLLQENDPSDIQEFTISPSSNYGRVNLFAASLDFP